jgi:hypothetical protein
MDGYLFGESLVRLKTGLAEATLDRICLGNLWIAGERSIGTGEERIIAEFRSRTRCHLVG